jgi:glycerol uptake facilitator-like aquaporin
MWKVVAAEYLGTLLLIGVIALVGNPLAISGALLAGILLFGSFSGGHFNPAVTLWAFLKNKVGAQRALLHVAAQLAAAATIWQFS